MGIRIRAGQKAFGFVLASLVALGVLPLAAQEPSTGAPAERQTSPVEKAVAASRRVPPHFGQIGLTPEQKESIYKIRGKHQARIESLQSQIAQLQGEMKAECEALLTDSQKQLLALRRDTATRARKAKAAMANSTVSSKTERPAN